jgi:hypothetical protein
VDDARKAANLQRGAVVTAFRCLSLCVALVAIGCRPATPPDLSEQQRSAIADSVRGLLGELATWMSSQGAGRAFSAFFDSAPGFVQAADGRITSPSFDSLATRYRSWAPPAGGRLAWDTVRVEPLGPGLAHFTGAFTESYAPQSGQPYVGHGVMSGVAIRRPAGWKIAALHTSLAPPSTP